MTSTLEEMLYLWSQMNQILEEHSASLLRQIDALFEAAAGQMAPEPKDTPFPSSWQAAVLENSSQKPNHAEERDPHDFKASACLGEVSQQTGRSYGSVFISEADMEQFVSKPTMWQNIWMGWPVEPIRTGNLADLVSSKRFDAITVLVIFAHIIFTIIETNWQMKHTTLATTTLMFNVELAFTCLYIVELALRFAVHRCYFFCNQDMRWNVLDLSLVMAGIADLVATWVTVVSSAGNPTFLRFFRVVRVAKKLLRVVRLLQFFSEMQLMIKCVLGSVRSLFWSFMLLFGVSVVFSILIVQQFTVFLADSRATTDSSFLLQVQENFGTVWVALLSLFMAISGGKNWDILFNLTKRTGTLNSAFFLVYIGFVWLSVTNIIISIFCDKAIKLAMPDIEESLLEKRKADLKKVRQIKHFFKSLDLNESGTLSIEELQACMLDVRSATYFEMMELDVKDAEAFFSMLTSLSGKAEVDVHAFVTGWLKLKGAATSLDVYTVQFQTQLLEEKMLREITGCGQEIMKLQREVIRLCAGYHESQDDRRITAYMEDCARAVAI